MLKKLFVARAEHDDQADVHASMPIVGLSSDATCV